MPPDGSADSQPPSAPAAAGRGLQRFFDLWARFYDARAPQALTYGPVHDAVCDAMERRPAPRAVLDVGCGTGILAARVAAAYPAAAVTGADMSPGMLAQARRRSDAVTWVEADAQRLPFADDSFDAISCTESFHWYPDQGRALAEFHRVLHADGALYLAFVNPAGVLVETAVNGLTRLVGRPARWVTAAHLAELLEGARFQVERRVKVRRWPPGVAMPTYLTIAVGDG